MSTVEVYVRSGVPPNTALVMYLRQDTTGDGNADNQEQQSISGGDQWFTISGFEDVDQNDTWVEFDFITQSPFDRSPQDTEQSPVVDAVTIRMLTESGEGDTITWDTEVDWNAGQAESEYVVHEAIADESASDVSPGYPSDLGNLEHFWTLHEDSGGTASDEVGSADATLSGVSSYSNTGPFGWDALGFDGSTTAYIDFGEPSSIGDNRNSAFAWVVWFNPDAVGGTLLTSEGTPIAEIAFGSGEIVFERDGTTRTISYGSGDLDEWNMAAFVSDGSDWRGELYNDTNHPSGTATSTATIGSISTADMIDSFEDQDLSEYTDVDINDWEFQTAPSWGSSVPDGTYILEGENFFNEIYSESGLDNYFGKGDTMALAHGHNSSYDGDGRFYFAYDGSDEYDIRLDYSSDNYGLRHPDGSLIDNASVSWNADSWYETEITWDDGSLGGSDGDITVTLYEHGSSWGSRSQVAELTGNSTANDGSMGIGFQTGINASGGEQYFDYLRLPGSGGGPTYGAAEDTNGTALVDSDMAQVMFFSGSLDSATLQAMFDAPQEGTYMTSSQVI